jgi:hypothetical protein
MDQSADDLLCNVSGCREMNTAHRSMDKTAMRQLITLLFITLIAFSGCDKRHQQLVGKWKTQSGSGENVWEFFENGTLSAGGAPGRYTLGDNNRLKIQTSTATFVYQLEFAGDRMSWKDPNGSTMELAKIK